ncbi:sensor histidine kinase [Methylophilus sp. 3sh_L]|uniref:sensor histidine kinase n=1 Tax=Methylophilus sp. 3sh_L TaxID=3377114 RepID=UPI00398EFDF4
MAKLRPRARIIRTIGDQLISGPEAALIELVKNSYDADSPYILIKITPPSISDSIIVTDGGHGMSEDDIINKWFEPATDEKLKRRTSPLGRRMLGAKGIGRFAASRLGGFTVLESVYELEGKVKQISKVEIDWSWFESSKYLDEVELDVLSEIRNDPDAELHTGIKLTISDLRDNWTKKNLETLIRELKRVASPIEDEISNFRIRLDISDFTEDNSGFDGQSLLETLNVNPITHESEGDNDPFLIRPFGLQNHADYFLKGSFDAQGAFVGEFIISRGDNAIQHIQIPPLVLTEEEFNCGPFSVSINIYDREKEAVQALFERMGINFGHIGVMVARRILTENAGISIFRRGFRIRPYGAPDFDWLELERQRVQDPSKRLGLTQVSGYLDIEDERVSHLYERSSREGLEHNGAFERLKRLVGNLLLHAEERRFQFRDKAGLSRKVKGDLAKVKDTATLKNITRAARALPLEFREKIETAIKRDASNLAIELSEIDEYQQILQSRSALGLVVAEVIHEGRRLINPVMSSAKALMDGVGYASEDSNRGRIYLKQLPDNAGTVYQGVKGLGQLLRKLDPLSGRKRGRPSNFNVNVIVTRCLDLFKDAIAENNIRVSVEVNKSLTSHGYESDFQAALLNIIDNAVHWVSTIEGERRISIDCSCTPKLITIGIENNGPVVDESYFSRLFDVGFTLKSDGTGLGLAISKEALRRSKGDLFFDETSEFTKFLIKIPMGD